MKNAIVFILLVCISGIFIQAASAATISVEPACLKVSPGDKFTVNIIVDPEGSEVYAASYHLYFNNSLLNATLQTKGPFLGDNTWEVTNETDNSFNSTHGRIRYSETRMLPETTGVTEPGVIARITFQAIAEHGGVSELHFDKVKLSDPFTKPILTEANNGSVEIARPSSPFLVYGQVFYGNGTEYNNPKVNITNLMNTSKKWQAERNADYNYYQLILTPCTDIIAGEVLQFNVTNPDGNLLSITNYTITQNDINNGGLFNFTLGPKPGIFDTEAPDNPYPSIMGVHNGTITPDWLIEANKIYTYACPGTGGHTEYVRIWGDDVDAHANWSGYISDWHNLTFNTTFTLESGEEYNFTIRTGSYPQIHHTPALQTTNGWINCTKFMDANGRVYYDWIPAVRLWKEVG